MAPVQSVLQDLIGRALRTADDSDRQYKQQALVLIRACRQLQSNYRELLDPIAAIRLIEKVQDVLDSWIAAGHDFNQQIRKGSIQDAVNVVTLADYKRLYPEPEAEVQWAILSRRLEAARRSENSRSTGIYQLSFKSAALNFQRKLSDLRPVEKPTKDAVQEYWMVMDHSTRIYFDLCRPRIFGSIWRSEDREGIVLKEFNGALFESEQAGEDVPVGAFHVDGGDGRRYTWKDVVATALEDLERLGLEGSPQQRMALYKIAAADSEPPSPASYARSSVYVDYNEIADHSNVVLAGSNITPSKSSLESLLFNSVAASCAAGIVHSSHQLDQTSPALQLAQEIVAVDSESLSSVSSAQSSTYHSCGDSMTNSISGHSDMTGESSMTDIFPGRQRSLSIASPAHERSPTQSGQTVAAQLASKLAVLLIAPTAPYEAIAQDMLMELVMNRAPASMRPLLDADPSAEARLRSEGRISCWVQYFRDTKNGKQYADTILCTMQEILDSSTSCLDGDERQLLLRIMLRFSQETKVIPSSLFKSDALDIRYDQRPRCGGFSDVRCGTLAGQKVAFKELRLTSGKPPSNEGIIMISPWMEDGNIPEYLRNHPRVDSLLKRKWISQVAHGLQYLHENGIIHGDLRGANILLDEAQNVHLADFGLSVLSDAGLSTLGFTGWNSGAPRWMAPEVLRDPPGTRPGDVYSFACVCLEIVTQSWPFPQIQGHQWKSFEQQIVYSGNATTPLDSWPESEDLDLGRVRGIVAPAFALEPSRRPSMRVLCDLLPL
ncbi:hypothetical protein NM688_g1303 [Phlebia brevispora]|uniref:Uncharacterized protein n=1 Tax=Phlebia brevispora TaxID=194682 RepID=A0ACC1TBX9_9APHY|nr:hypothetical protein NM688_g1303 [Phlebia brevispora]